MTRQNKVPFTTNVLVKYFLLVVPFLVIAYLLRFIPIHIMARVWMAQATPTDQAFQRAAALFLKDPVVTTILGVTQGIVWFALVFCLVVFIERQLFRWNDFHQDRRVRPAAALILGAFIGTVLFLAYQVNHHLASPGSPILPAGLHGTIESAAFTTLYYLSNGFGEEIAFRGYLQSRLIERFRPVGGILLSSVLFVSLHLLVQPMNAITLLSGLLLWILIGTIYYRFRSLFLVGMLHASLNILPVIFDRPTPDLSGLYVHLIALIILLPFLLRQKVEKIAIGHPPCN